MRRESSVYHPAHNRAQTEGVSREAVQEKRSLAQWNDHCCMENAREEARIKFRRDRQRTEKM